MSQDNLTYAIQWFFIILGMGLFMFLVNAFIVNWDKMNDAKVSEDEHECNAPRSHDE